MKHDDVEPYLGLMLVGSLCYLPSYVKKTHVLIMSSHCKMCIMFENYVIRGMLGSILASAFDVYDDYLLR